MNEIETLRKVVKVEVRSLFEDEVQNGSNFEKTCEGRDKVLA